MKKPREGHKSYHTGAQTVPEEREELGGDSRRGQRVRDSGDLGRENRCLKENFRKDCSTCDIALTFAHQPPLQ